MVFLSFLVLFFITASATDTTYFGLRVAKSCKAMLRDNLKLGEDIHKDISHVEIGEISDTQGDWWNRRTLILRNIRASNFIHENSKFTLDKCNMLPTGLLQVVAYGGGFVWDVTFEWRFKLFSLDISGKGTAQITSEKIEFVQNYLDGLPDTNMYVKWNVTQQNLEDVMLPLIHDWLRTMLIEKLTPKLTLKINMHTDPINKNIIKPYEELVTKTAKGEVVKVKNDLHDATEAVYNDQSYSVFDYKATISAPEAHVTHEVKKSVTTPVSAKAGKHFDYQICYSAKLFGEYLSVLYKANYFTLDVSEILKTPTTVGYYKGILPDLGNRYPDDEKVKISCHRDESKEVEYLNNTENLIRRLQLPVQCEFEVEKFSEVFLTMWPSYDVMYVISQKERNVTAILLDARVQSVETKPVVDFQGKFVALELADMFSGLIEGKEFAGFVLDTVRADKFKYVDIDQNDGDVCLLFEDTEQ